MSWDPTWEEIFRSHEWGKYPPEELIRFIARRYYGATQRRDVSVLEVGCGTGANIWYLAREGFTVAGIDGSPTAIARAGERLAEEGLTAELVVGDIVDVPAIWSPGSFDAVIDVVALSSNPVSDLPALLEAMRTVLRPDGWLYSSLIASGTTGEGAGTAVEPGTYRDITEGPLAGRGLIHFFRRDEIDDLFAGFRELQVDSLERTLNGGAEVFKLWNVLARR